MLQVDKIVKTHILWGNFPETLITFSMQLIFCFVYEAVNETRRPSPTPLPSCFWLSLILPRVVSFAYATFKADRRQLPRIAWACTQDSGCVALTFLYSAYQPARTGQTRVKAFGNHPVGPGGGGRE